MSGGWTQKFGICFSFSGARDSYSPGPTALWLARSLLSYALCFLTGGVHIGSPDPGRESGPGQREGKLGASGGHARRREICISQYQAPGQCNLPVTQSYVALSPVSSLGA